MHRTTSKFWTFYRQLPAENQQAAKKAFRMLKENLGHPSLQFKPVGEYWSVRVGLNYRALAIQRGSDWVWIWIGPHTDYDKFLK